MSVVGVSTREGEVNREALKGDSSLAGAIGASRGFRLFCTNASRTGIQDRVHVLELWDTFHMLVGIVEVKITGMSKSMVPEKAFRVLMESEDRTVDMDQRVRSIIGISMYWEERQTCGSHRDGGSMWGAT